jgi:hypothetical protein
MTSDDELTKNLYAALTERDEWATPADLLRSLRDVGLHIVTEAERKVLEACAAIPEQELRTAGNWRGWAKPIGEAELARRGGTQTAAELTSLTGADPHEQ